MTHEEAVLEKHPTACEFRAVRWLGSSLIGWTFEIPAEVEEDVRYGWVTDRWVNRAEGEQVSADRLRDRRSALINLDQYVKSLTGCGSALEPIQVGS
ncbi:hypothetical protein ACFW2V_12595 [Streptomyces sp. NPDC058947]|uniref:hypothetical protein n=1 Tax=Streptomyces sp. NPDC058947 TaxID=3346675 RepID=UPI00368B1A7E